MNSSLTPAIANPFQPPQTTEEISDIGEVTIKCSSGISGDCFRMVFDMCTYDSIGIYACSWTGSPSNYCSLLIVKICNIFIDYVM